MKTQACTPPLLWTEVAPTYLSVLASKLETNQNLAKPILNRFPFQPPMAPFHPRLSSESINHEDLFRHSITHLFSMGGVVAAERRRAVRARSLMREAMRHDARRQNISRSAEQAFAAYLMASTSASLERRFLIHATNARNNRRLFVDLMGASAAKSKLHRRLRRAVFEARGKQEDSNFTSAHDHHLEQNLKNDLHRNWENYLRPGPMSPFEAATGRKTIRLKRLP